MSTRMVATDRRYEAPRFWSNQELRKFAPHVGGTIINVSAEKDQDKEGNLYASYFTKAYEYQITNTYPHNLNRHTEFMIDLRNPIEDQMENYVRDCVFAHTVLEHIYDVQTAFANLAKMTGGLLIVVVPFMQPLHYTDDYGDFWRFTPFSLDAMFRANGLTLIYESFTPASLRSSIYLFAVGTPDPEDWAGRVPHQRIREMPGRNAPKVEIGNEIIDNSTITKSAFYARRFMTKLLGRNGVE